MDLVGTVSDEGWKSRIRPLLETMDLKERKSADIVKFEYMLVFPVLKDMVAYKGT